VRDDTIHRGTDNIGIKIKRIKKGGGKNMDKYILDDVVGAMLYYSRVTLFTGNSEKLHNTFFSLRKKFKILEGLISFTDYSVYPFSMQLEDAFNTLQICRIIGMENPDFEKYQIKEKGKKFIEDNVITIFNDSEKIQIKEMAGIFDKECGQHEFIR
jgi:hypothetical protein